MFIILPNDDRDKDNIDFKLELKLNRQTDNSFVPCVDLESERTTFVLNPRANACALLVNVGKPGIH